MEDQFRFYHDLTYVLEKIVEMVDYSKENGIRYMQEFETISNVCLSFEYDPLYKRYSVRVERDRAVLSGSFSDSIDPVRKVTEMINKVIPSS